MRRILKFAFAAAALQRDRCDRILAGERFDLGRDELRRRLVLGWLSEVGLVQPSDWTLEGVPLAERLAELLRLRETLEISLLKRIAAREKLSRADISGLTRVVPAIVALVHETAAVAYAREVALTGLLPTMTGPLVAGVSGISWAEIEAKYAIQHSPEDVIVRASARRNEAAVRIRRARVVDPDARLREAEADFELARQLILKARKRRAYLKTRGAEAGPERRLLEPIGIGTPYADVVEAQLRARVAVLLPSILPPDRQRGRPRKHPLADAGRGVVEKIGGGDASP